MWKGEALFLAKDLLVAQVMSCRRSKAFGKGQSRGPGVRGDPWGNSMGAAGVLWLPSAWGTKGRMEDASRSPMALLMPICTLLYAVLLQDQVGRGTTWVIEA